MKTKVSGQRPRPRVALLGDFKAKDLKKFKNMFPTIWQADYSTALLALVDGREVDLLIIGKDIVQIPKWVENTHVICFSERKLSMPGPHRADRLNIHEWATTEGFFLSELPLSLNRQREADLAKLEGVKGWPILKLRFSNDTTSEEDETGHNIFIDGAVVLDPYSELPFATIFQRQKTKSGVAWLPREDFDQGKWTEVILMEWALSDPEAFPAFGDWTKSPEWLSSEEKTLSSQIKALELKKSQLISEMNGEITSASAKLTEASLKANAGRRRLITAQGNDLVDEVASVFEQFGYEVEHVDRTIPSGAPRKEDLRLKDTTLPDWEAIVEIRGYARSGGTTADLSRMSRFASFYQTEKGRLPDKRIYVVNGQIELVPSQRQRPLASAKEDVKEFAQQDGLVISSLDLFRASKIITEDNFAEIRKSILGTKGQWEIK